jgi:2',3'-cyclic-nucleotide 2'-phosphodiesterase (5'-nucleotidase family)
MRKGFLIFGVCLLLAVTARAQTPNFDYGYFVSNAAGYIVNGNVYDIPTFGDWDQDGDQDLMVGVFFNGNIYYYQNTAGPNNTPVFAPYTILQADGVNISVTYG